MRLKLLSVAAMLVASLAAHAAQIYTLTIAYPGVDQFNDVFSFSETSLLVSPTTISSGSSSGNLTAVSINPTQPNCPDYISVGSTACVEAFAISGNSIIYSFGVPLTNDGTYTPTNFGQPFPYVTLKIAASGSPVPEPSSVALLGTGLLGAAGFLKRRFAQ